MRVWSRLWSFSSRSVLRIFVYTIFMVILAVSVLVQLPSGYSLDHLGGIGPSRAIILYHPSREARFSDDLSLALAEGLVLAGFSVDRATLSDATPPTWPHYDFVAIVSNTYYWTPDFPTLRYLARAHFPHTPAIGLIGGAGATRRSEHILAEKLEASGAQLIATRSFWLLRPNDENEPGLPNRQVALAQARQFGRQASASCLR